MILIFWDNTEFNNFAFKLKKAIESGKSLTQGVGGEIKLRRRIKITASYQ